MERGRRRRRTAGNGSGRLDSRAAGQAAASWGQSVSQHTAACRGLGEKGMATGLYVPVVCGWTYVWVCEEEGEEEKDKSKRSTRRTKQDRRKVWKFWGGGEGAVSNVVGMIWPPVPPWLRYIRRTWELPWNPHHPAPGSDWPAKKNEGCWLLPGRGWGWSQGRGKSSILCILPLWRFQSSPPPVAPPAPPSLPSLASRMATLQSPPLLLCRHYYYNG